MKMKENVRYFIIIGCVFLLIYTLFAIRPLGKELMLVPQWTVNIKEFYEEQPKVEDKNSIMPFRLGQNMGYFTETGKILLMESFPFKASISKDYRASYVSDAANVEFYSSMGIGVPEEQKEIFSGTIQGIGFPFFSDDRIYLFGPGGTSFSQHKSDGTKIWSFENYVPVISFASSPAGTAAGFADGEIKVFSSEGTPLYTFEPGGSVYPIVLGLDLSDSGKQLACVSGIDRQRFVLAQEKNGLSKVVFHTYLDIDQREPVLVQFSADEKKVFYSRALGLGIVDCVSMEDSFVKMDGKVLAIKEIPQLDFVCVLTKGNNNYSVYFVEGFDNLVGSFTFRADSAFIDVKGTNLFVGRDDTISCISLDMN